MPVNEDRDSSRAAARPFDQAAKSPAALETALRTLTNAADDVGVKFFDTDTMDPVVERMQAATLAARALLDTTSGTLPSGDTFGNEDDGPEGGHSEFHSGPDRVVVDAIKAALCKEMGTLRGGWNDLATDIARAVAAVAGEEQDNAKRCTPSMQAEIDRLRAALVEIRDHWACQYDHPRKQNEMYRGAYGIGVTDGHRAAALIAYRALANQE